MSDEHVPKKIQLDAIKYHRFVMHLEEEAKLIEDEMRTTVSFYLKDWQEIVSVVKERSVMPYNSGALMALQLNDFFMQK